MIKDLKKKLYERECKEIKSLQGQIDDLVEKNMEKERAMKNLENDTKVNPRQIEEVLLG